VSEAKAADGTKLQQRSDRPCRILHTVACSTIHVELSGRALDCESLKPCVGQRPREWPILELLRYDRRAIMQHDAGCMRRIEHHPFACLAGQPQPPCLD
jgi:hypothetical protein